MMGSLGQAQNDTESIAQFMQRLSQATNIFISPEDPTGKEDHIFSGTHQDILNVNFTPTDHWVFYSIMIFRVFWRAADASVPDLHHVRPGHAASWTTPATGAHPASAVPVLHPELPQWQRAHWPEHCCKYHSSVFFLLTWDELLVLKYSRMWGEKRVLSFSLRSHCFVFPHVLPFHPTGGCQQSCQRTGGIHHRELCKCLMYTTTPRNYRTYREMLNPQF